MRSETSKATISRLTFAFSRLSAHQHIFKLSHYNMSEIKLKDIDTHAPKEFDKKETKEKLEKILEELDALQNLLCAESKYSLLVVIQGLDASGKDGAVRNVFGKLNPQGVLVTSFKEPTKKELAHDFLRAHS